MIKKIRLKFVFFTMTILIFVFVAMGFISYGVLKSNFKSSTETVLKALIYSENFDITKNDTFTNVRSIIIKETISGELTVTFDEKIFNEKYVLSLYSEAKNSGKKEGSIDNTYYMTECKENVACIFAATDRTLETQIYKNTLVKIYGVLFFSLCALALVVFFASYKVTEPLAETLLKQKQFISDASHELKTPIAIISANADVMKNENGSNEWLENIKEQTARMGGLINDMLSLAKMEETARDVTPTTFNLSSIVTNSVLSFDAVAFEQNKKLSTYITPNISYKGDEESVKKIVTILVENALKYSNERGDVICSLEMINNKTIIKVYNTTDSIKPELKNKLFERFYRSEQSRNRSTGGSGLGLSIAKKIADNNKWKIGITIEEDRSLTITLQI